MFKIKWLDQEYVVYSVIYNEQIEDTLFLIYDNNEWQWIRCFLCEPILDKGE